MRVIFFGSTQLRSKLATLATLAERGHDVYHIDLAKDSSENYIRRIYVELRQGQPVPIKQIDMPYIEQKSIITRKIKPPTVSTFSLMQLKDISPDAIISHLESWPLAYSISKRLHVPLVFYSTNIRGLLFFYYLRFHRKYSEILYAPLSVMYNLAISHLSDFTIVPNKKPEKILKSFGDWRIKLLQYHLFARTALLDT